MDDRTYTRRTLKIRIPLIGEPTLADFPEVFRRGRAALDATAAARWPGCPVMAYTLGLPQWGPTGAVGWMLVTAEILTPYTPGAGDTAPL